VRASTVTLANQREAALYRLYAADGTLLYVGAAYDPEKRWTEHAVEKSWWPEVATKSVEWFETRDAALAAESTAIATEEPFYNVVGIRRQRTAPDDGNPDAFHASPNEALEAVAEARLLRAETVNRADSEFNASIRKALRSGASAISISHAAGLSRARVYQIRDGRR
jgi:predicted GIY-YIG superfamily endonuclease